MTTTTFSELLQDEKILSSLNQIGITKPTPVQSASIPLALAGKDLIVQAQTGSGKTLAFLLPIILQIRANPKDRGTMALIVTPTREIAQQVKKVVDSVAPDITPACIIGGASGHAQEKELRKDPRIIIGTPGRLLDFMKQKKIRLNNCRTFVLDEADEMLSMGFLEDVKAILKKLPVKRQGCFFSATISPSVQSLSFSFLKKPEILELEAKEEYAPTIEHLFCRVSGGVSDKANALCNLLAAEKTQSAIVFCNTKSDTELVERFLLRRDFKAARINSDLSQNERNRVLEKLKNGQIKFLIATDVAARGIDIKELELVVNYSLHDEPEVYVHRTGRTGRAGAAGRAISLISPLDFYPFKALKNHLKVPLLEIPVPGESPAASNVKDAA